MKQLPIMNKLLISAFVLFLLLVFPVPFTSVFAHSTTVHASTEKTSDDTKIKLNVNSKSLVLDKSFSLKVYRSKKGQKIYFKTNDSSIATIKKTTTKKALITAKKIGETTISVIIKNGTKTETVLKCKLTVTPPAISIKLIVAGKDNKINLFTGDKEILRQGLKPSTTTEKPVFISNNPKIATVSAKGVITAHLSGHAIIYACIDNGKYDYCIVYVSEKNDK